MNDAWFGHGVTAVRHDAVVGARPDLVQFPGRCCRRAQVIAAVDDHPRYFLQPPGVGEQLIVAVEDGRIVMTPASVIPDDQAWFWTPEWQAKEREVDEALARGERGQFFSDGETFLKFLADDAGENVEEIKRRADV